MKVVHLARDEKFIPLMVSLFDEAFPGANHWVVARGRRGRRFVANAPQVVFRAPWQFRLRRLGDELAGADMVVLHSITTIFANALRDAPPQATVVWIGWGYDYYSLLKAQLGGLLLPRTKALVGTDDEGDAGSPAARHWPWRKTPALLKVATRIDVSCTSPADEPLLRAAVPALQARMHVIPLFTVEDVFGRGPRAMSGADVLVGNSATATNNHLDALALLRDRPGLGQLVVPLSYGDATYGQRVAAAGREWFGARFEPLLGWMAIDDYNGRIARCGFVVMNHRRQQAVGNIGAALYKGATVYLRRENPLFGFYTDLGVHLRAVDELEADPVVPLRPLDDSERAANRAAIAAHYSRAAVVAAIRALAELRH